MASVYKPKGRHIYRVEFKDQHGRTRTISSATDDKRCAESLGSKIEEDADRIRVGLAPKYPDLTGVYLGLVEFGDKSWKDGVASYVAELARRGCKEGNDSHRTRSKRWLERIGKECGWQMVRQVQAEGLKEFLQRLAGAGVGPATSNNYLGCAKAFSGYAVEMGWITQDPFAKVKRLRVGQTGRRVRRRAYLVEELQRLCAAAKREEWRVCYQVAAYSGFRRRELGRLTREDCTPTGPRPRWHIPAEKTKNKQAVDLPMTPECAAALAPHWQTLPAGGKLVKVPRWEEFAADRERAGIQHKDERGRVADFHSLRCTFATLLARQYPIEVVSKLMRHSTIHLTTSLYLDLGLDRRGEGEWVLSPLLPGVPTAGPTTQAGGESGATQQPAA
jgi:integrase